MRFSDSIKNLAIAMIKFQTEVQNPANTANNPFFKSKYAPLPDILSQNRPLLSKHGLCVIQSPGGDGASISITTLLMHESGEWIELDPLVLKAEKATAQGAGSAITYGRRYGISALLGISSEDDDDGNHASQNGTKPAGQASIPSPKQAPAIGANKPPTTEPTVYCSDCTLAITENAKAIKTFSEKKFGRILCRDCQAKAKPA